MDTAQGGHLRAARRGEKETAGRSCQVLYRLPSLFERGMSYIHYMNSTLPLHSLCLYGHLHFSAPTELTLLYLCSVVCPG